jgi:hypothetical protein
MKQTILNSISEAHTQNVTNVKNSLASLFTKDDVEKVLKTFTENIEKIIETQLTNVTINGEGFSMEQIFDIIQNDLNLNEYMELDVDTAEFEMSSNTIYLNDCDFSFKQGDFLGDLEDMLNQRKMNKN